ncbi:MAG: catalase family protein, partial [Luteimonas sp.]
LLRGELRVYAGLAPELAQGLFAMPATYPVVMRSSTSPGDPIHDSVSLPRGLALKVIGVDGERFQIGTPGRTQDFVMANGPTFPKGDPKAFLRNLKLLAATTDRAEGAKKALSATLRGTEQALEAVGGESATLKAMGGHPQTHPLGETYFSQAALRHGDYIAKYALRPASPALAALTDTPMDERGHENALREAVQAFFSGHEAEWELCVQLCTDPEAMPVEDTTKEWDASVSPFRPVASVRVPRQQVWVDGVSEAIDQRLAFNPWHVLRVHQPLGAIMRARREVYRAMSAFRAGQNGVQIVEPSTREALDALFEAAAAAR